MNVLKSEIRSTLDLMGSSDKSERLLEKCQVLCDKHDLSLHEFQQSLDAFLVSNSDTSFSLETIGKFEQQIMKENQKDRVQPGKSKNYLSDSPTSDFSMPGKRPFHMSTPDGSERPGAAMRTTKEASPGSVVSSQSPMTIGKEIDPKVNNYAIRSNKGASVVTMDMNLGERGDFLPSTNRPYGVRGKLTTNEEDFENIVHRYRFMYTPLEERIKMLDRHLKRIQDEMKERLMIPELTPVGVPSQDTVWVCGRICCDSSEGKINSSSILLEGSRAESSGRRVRLDISNIPAYSLFPGQIVLVEGINSSGRSMVASKIVEGMPKPLLKTPPSKLLDMHYSPFLQNGKALKVMVAAGPFSTTENLHYEPFTDLLSRVLNTKPDLLILVGPFVDITQPLLSTPEVRLPELNEDGQVVHTHEAASYEMVFRLQVIRDGLQSLFESDPSLPTQIVMIPSLLDGHHECVFPQPPFGDRDRLESRFFEEPLGELKIPSSTDKDKRVHLLPNPCMFRFNEVLFGATANDVLFSLSADETSKSTGNRLQRLAGHILQQQSFAPIFPVPVNGYHQADLRHARHWQMGVSPDVLILPSKLAHMAKDTLGTLVVNPGQLAKGNSGGTFAELSIHPMNGNELRQLVEDGKDSTPLEHGICGRTSVNVIRI